MYKLLDMALSLADAVSDEEREGTRASTEGREARQGRGRLLFFLLQVGRSRALLSDLGFILLVSISSGLIHQSPRRFPPLLVRPRRVPRILLVLTLRLAIATVLPRSSHSSRSRFGHARLRVDLDGQGRALRFKRSFPGSEDGTVVERDVGDLVSGELFLLSTT